MKDLSEIKTHWEAWATTFGDDLRATTRSSNIKKLEIKALDKMIRRHACKSVKDLSILEVGCGNGFNAISLSQSLECKIEGFDFIPEMVESANSNKSQLDKSICERIHFKIGDVLDLDLSKKYDVVFSCRCLINIPTWELQKTAISDLTRVVKPGGILLLLENFNDNHSEQNNLRELVGLKRRDVAEFNNFFNYIDFKTLINELGLSIVDESNFSSLHDILQYVIVPLITGGKSIYDHEVMHAVTKLLLELEFDQEEKFGEYGQNKLVVIRNE